MEIILANRLSDLIKQMHGRKNCTIFISTVCAKQIKRMDFEDYLELEEDLKIRNIKLEIKRFYVAIT